jgi:hypothetical protein
MKKLAFFLSSASLLCSIGLSAGSAIKETPVKEQFKKKDNAPARVSLQETGDRPALFFDVAFLYYFLGEDGLDLANGAAVVTSGTSEGDVIAIDHSKTLLQNFEYTPGVMVGIGASWKECDLKAEFTWIGQTTTKSRQAKPVNPLLGSGVWVLNNWFQQTSTSGQGIAATHVSSKWDIDIYLADVTVRRPIYEGCYLSLVPFYGIRGESISQHLDVKIDVSPFVIANLAHSHVTSHNSSHSWGLGPIVGFDFFWLLTSGFRVEGNGGLGLLFTQFTKVKHWENVASASSQPSNLSVKLSDVNCLRPELNLALGIGWGTYLKGKKYYLDCSVSYDFLFFWQQNMMRKLVDQTVAGTGAAAGDLYLHGLDVAVSFYF